MTVLPWNLAPHVSGCDYPFYQPLEHQGSSTDQHSLREVVIHPPIILPLEHQGSPTDQHRLGEVVIHSPIILPLEHQGSSTDQHSLGEVVIHSHIIQVPLSLKYISSIKYSM